MFDPQLQQRDEALPLGNRVTMTHLDISLKALGQVDKGGGRTGMQASLVQDHRIKKVRVISLVSALGGHRRPLSR